MTTLVTGATGFLGSHLVGFLLERGESVRALVRPNSNADWLTAAGATVYRGDLAVPASLPPAVEGVDLVWHAGARTGIWGPRSEYEAVNVRGVEALLDAAMAAGVERFVHISSHTVHGSDVGGIADETAPFQIESNPYVWSKIMGERLLEAAIKDRKAPVTIIRAGLIYGPRDMANFYRFATMIEKGRMVVLGSGDNHMPLIYVRDVAQGVLQASQAQEALGRAYLLVNDQPVTQRQFLDAIAAELDAPPPRWHLPYRLALTIGLAAETAGHLLKWQQPPPLTRFGLRLLGGENRFVISRAREEIGFSPQIDLAEGIRRSAAWYRTETHANAAREQ
jgi:nucleoside-diphosphate-sugar epimerase